LLEEEEKDEIEGGGLGSSPTPASSTPQLPCPTKRHLEPTAGNSSAWSRQLLYTVHIPSYTIQDI
jgi:hypothetical protein